MGEACTLCTLDVDGLVEAVAQRFVELLQDEQPNPQGLVDAAAVAKALGVSRDWTYRHWRELGGVRIGSGPRGRLRFDVERAREAARHGRSDSQPDEAPARKHERRRRPRARTGTDVDLVRIPGDR